MTDKELIHSIENTLSQIDPDRRNFLRKILLGTVTAAALPMMSSTAFAEELEQRGRKGKGGGKGGGKGKGNNSGGGKGKGNQGGSGKGSGGCEGKGKGKGGGKGKGKGKGERDGNN